MAEQQVTADAHKSARHWLALTPDRLVVAVLLVVGSLLALDYFGWIGMHGQKGWPVFLAVAFAALVLLYPVGRFAATSGQIPFRCLQVHLGLDGGDDVGGEELGEGLLVGK